MYNAQIKHSTAADNHDLFLCSLFSNAYIQHRMEKLCYKFGDKLAHRCQKKHQSQVMKTCIYYFLQLRKINTKAIFREKNI